ncbi:unnamed protein product, partial [Meganyctiphanes norvegica]
MDEIKLVPQVQRPLIKLPSSLLTPTAFSQFLNDLSRPQKVVIISVGVGITCIAVAARYFRRRRRIIRKSALTRTNDPNRAFRKNKPITIRSPSGEIHCLGGNISPGFHRQVRQSSISISSDRMSVVSGSTITQAPTSSEVGQHLAPHQYGVMGMEALETATGYWEDALAAYSAGVRGGIALTSAEEAEFTALLQRVIDDAYSLQDQCEHLFLHQHSVLFRSCSVTPVPSEIAEELRERRTTITSATSYESFVSASGDIADLRDLEEFDETQYPLYLDALKKHENGGIPYRDVRTERVNCGNDVEYICKLHCIRLACSLIFGDESTRLWFIDAGRQVLADIVVKADKEAQDLICFKMSKTMLD